MLKTVYSNAALLLSLALCLLAGCDNMADQPKLEVYEASDLVPNERGLLKPPARTVARGTLLPPAVDSGKVDGDFIDQVPIELSQEDLLRGGEMYGVHCVVCHGNTGKGDGIVVRRGFPSPPSYHRPALRAAPDGYLFDVISNGYGVMYPFKRRIAEEDRWRIVAYIRVLQLAKHAKKSNLPEGMFEALQEEAAEPDA